MPDEEIEFPWCPECRRNSGKHKCTTCKNGRCAHGEVQCKKCAKTIEVPDWVKTGRRR